MAREYTDDQKQIIRQSFNGDAQAYEANFKQARAETINWAEIDPTAIRHRTDLKKRCRHRTEKRLGYMPEEESYLRFEPFLRNLLFNFENGLMDKKQYLAEAEELYRLVRNRDLIGWVEDELYDEESMQEYETYFPEFKSQARVRLVRFLGHEPEVEASLQAELRYRKVMADDDSFLPETITNLDHKMLDIVKYRELAVLWGKAKADKGPI